VGIIYDKCDFSHVTFHVFDLFQTLCKLVLELDASVLHLYCFSLQLILLLLKVGSLMAKTICLGR
jgi:hypothetical protein